MDVVATTGDIARRRATAAPRRRACPQLARRTQSRTVLPTNRPTPRAFSSRPRLLGPGDPLAIDRGDVRGVAQPADRARLAEHPADALDRDAESRAAAPGQPRPGDGPRTGTGYPLPDDRHTVRSSNPVVGTAPPVSGGKLSGSRTWEGGTCAALTGCPAPRLARGLRPQNPPSRVRIIPGPWRRTSWRSRVPSGRGALSTASPSTCRPAPPDAMIPSLCGTAAWGWRRPRPTCERGWIVDGLAS